MSGERLWSLRWGPEVIPLGDGADWSAWRWWVERAGEVRVISVYVAADAIAVDSRQLDGATVEARATLGQSAVEQMLDMPDPFAFVVCIRGGLRHHESAPDEGGRAARARPPDAPVEDAGPSPY